jgi:NDP-sugar pyrophosphorylase family protein
VAAFVSDASFRDIGTPADCLRTSLEMAAVEGDRLVSRDAHIDPSAVVERTAVWDDVTIGAGARLDECIVADHVRIPAGAQYARCAIVPARTESPGHDERVEHGLLVRAL